MEKMHYQSNHTSEDDANIEIKQIDEPQSFKFACKLQRLIPYQILELCDHNQSQQAIVHEALLKLHEYPRPQELYSLFREIGVQLRVWANKSTPSQKSEYIFKALDQNVEENLKRVNSETESFVKTLQSKQKSILSKGSQINQQKNENFDWLHLKTPHDMLRSKLKTKLVQTINQFKNQKKLREVMGKKLSEDQKIHLEDDSFDLTDDQKSKASYDWTEEDQKLFLNNIAKLKEKFTKTEFLKNCHRYKFITDTELATLAAEEISRKLDKSNKAFLSRDFLLDKYFSTKDNLTEKQMKFILKTSPLLSKCVDKAFVRAAIKNIRYEDIDKMELQIAEEIITKFQTIRNLVRNSRKTFKQAKNNLAKEKITKFQQKQKYEHERLIQQDHLSKHKTKMMRNLNYNGGRRSTNRQSESSQKKQPINKNNKIKMCWPVPLNYAHLSTGIFIKDCSQQCNQDFNEYEKSYCQRLFNTNTREMPAKTAKNSQNKENMIKFYTGGPIDNYSSFNGTITSNWVSPAEKGKKETMRIICQVFKTSHYCKQITQKIDNYELEEILQATIKQQVPRNIKTYKSICEISGIEHSTRTKKNTDLFNEEPSITQTEKRGPLNEQSIKNKILEGKEKAKTAVYIKKLLTLSAENSFLSLKALKIKFTPSQINTKDRKGNSALFYATKHQNKEFVDYLLAQRADVNAKCEKGQTPLHNAFKSSQYCLICKCLMGHPSPNLNILDCQGKTPLAYCSRKILERLGLQKGVVSVPVCELSKPHNFNNNNLLSRQKLEDNKEDQLEASTEIKGPQYRISVKLAADNLA